MTAPTPDLVDTILERLGHEHFGMIVARNREATGSADWHRFDQARWAFKTAALDVARMAGRSTIPIHNEWTPEWSPGRVTSNDAPPPPPPRWTSLPNPTMEDPPDRSWLSTDPPPYNDSAATGRRWGFFWGVVTGLWIQAIALAVYWWWIR